MEKNGKYVFICQMLFSFHYSCSPIYTLGEREQNCFSQLLLKSCVLFGENGIYKIENKIF